MYEGRAAALVIAAGATTIAFIVLCQTMYPGVPFSITSVAGLLLVTPLSILGIAGVLIPLETMFKNAAKGVTVAAVVAANCLTTAITLEVLQRYLFGRMGSDGVTMLIGFAAVAALIWLLCDRFYRKLDHA